MNVRNNHLWILKLSGCVRITQEVTRLTQRTQSIDFNGDGIGRYKMGSPGTRPPPCNFFHFHEVFSKNLSTKRSPLQQIHPHAAECSQFNWMVMQPIDLSGGGDIQVNWLHLLHGVNLLSGSPPPFKSIGCVCCMVNFLR